MPEENEVINKEVDKSIYNKKITSIPANKPEIGIDTEQSIINKMVELETASSINIGQIESFSTISQSRDQLYTMLDNMASDPMVAAALEIYAEDSTEANDDGRIVWADSVDDDARKYVEFLLDTLNVDKNIYKWVYSLCKYGDIYLRLFRESEVDDGLFSGDFSDKKKLNESRQDVAKLDSISEDFSQADQAEDSKEKLEENVNMKVFSHNDKFIHYIEMIPNPAEMFEITRFGKSYAYIQAPVGVSGATNYTADQSTMLSSLNYKFKRRDVNLYSATEFVHGALEDNVSRVPEQVQIFMSDDDFDNGSSGLNYSVKRGQSLLYPAFKAWRNKSLLENSVLLNRITKSSIIRIIQVEVGDMPKEQVQSHLYNIKSLIEQKSALSAGNSLEEYTNPGPIENTVYVPTRGGQGNLSVQQIGDDVDVKSLADLEYFKDAFYGSIRIPKQYLGDTDDATGFNGGTSLSIVSSRYAKTIKRIQATIIQTITDAINLLLLDKGLDQYVNNFVLHMMPPTTQEEIDRREYQSNRISIARDILDLLSDIDNPAAKLTITKDLLSDIVSDPDIMAIVQEEIDKLLQEQKEEEYESDSDDISMSDDDFYDDGPSGGSDFGSSNFDNDFNDFDMGSDTGSEDFDTSSIDTGDSSSSELPSMSDIGVDFADAEAEI